MELKSNNIVITGLPDSPFTKEEKQRNDAWFEARRGKFTGSKIKDLMSCGRSSAKMEWDRPEKIIDFSKGAIKYIFSRAMERKRNKTIQTPETAAMKFGTNMEADIIHLAFKKYTKVGFIEFIPDIAGASPDGLIDNVGIEAKATTTWESLYDRAEECVDQSHDDFWQLQSEMLALKVNSIHYIVAEPPESIFEPVLTDISIRLVESSPLHQKAIIHRCMIGNEAIKLFLSGMGFKEAIEKAVTNYKF